MKSLNKVQLIGYVGKDAEVRYTAAGVAVGEFSMATSEKWKDKTSGEDKERTEWHTVAAWAKLGELVGEYVKKGLPVYVEGTLRTESWEKDGQKHYRTKIQATNIIFLREKQTEAPARQTPKPATPDSKPKEVDAFEDDIPF